MTSLTGFLHRTTTSMRVVAAFGALVVAGTAVALAGGTGSTARPATNTTVAKGSVNVATGATVAPSTAAATSGGAAVRDDVAAPSPPSGIAVPETVPDGSIVPSPGTHVVRRAAVTLETARRRSGDAFDRVVAVATDRGGYIASSTRSRGDTPGGVLELRVPADRFDDARRALAAIATVKSEEIHGDDVGGQLVDLDARIRSLQAEEQTLRALVGQAKTVGEVLQVQPQLFDVRRQIEQLQAQRQNLDQAASFATLSVTITERGVAPVRPPRPEPVLARSAHRAWNAAGAVVGGMLIALGASGPFVLLGLLAWAAWHVRRRRPRPGATATVN